MAITPMFFEQIEKFQCLKLSTTQGPSHGTPRRHVARVTCPQTCPKVCQLLVQISPKDGLVLVLVGLRILKRYDTCMHNFPKLMDYRGEV